MCLEGGGREIAIILGGINPNLDFSLNHLGDYLGVKKARRKVQIMHVSGGETEIFGEGARLQ